MSCPGYWHQVPTSWVAWYRCNLTFPFWAEALREWSVPAPYWNNFAPDKNYVSAKYSATNRFTLPTDDSGRWGQGGLFSAISRRSLLAETQYELASRMRGTVCDMKRVIGWVFLVLPEKNCSEPPFERISIETLDSSDADFYQHIRISVNNIQQQQQQLYLYSLS